MNEFDLLVVNDFDVSGGRLRRHVLGARRARLRLPGGLRLRQQGAI